MCVSTKIQDSIDQLKGLTHSVAHDKVQRLCEALLKEFRAEMILELKCASKVAIAGEGSLADKLCSFKYENNKEKL